MRVAFYAPMKAPDHPVPSGDRSMARLLWRAMERSGHQVVLASRLRGRVADGDAAEQARRARLGARIAERIVGGGSPPPDLWFTYHLYYKAPDWIGPRVARALDIPYVVAEASVAPKRAGGPWDMSHRAVLDALAQADAVIPLNPRNAACLPDPAKLRDLPPFVEIPDSPGRASARAHWRATADLPDNAPWIIAAGMMRAGDKLASYRLLAEALARLAGLEWVVLLAGDGPARGAVEEAFAALPGGRVRFLGALPPEALHGLFSAGDLYVWPAVNEAYGMALLEAQALGLPVVAGREGGVPAVVADGVSGLLSAPRDPAALSAAIARLLEDPDRRRALGQGASRYLRQSHGFEAAAEGLDRILRGAAADHRQRKHSA
jgi:glycosyltransferase involved in cell wall biosynthesis